MRYSVILLGLLIIFTSCKSLLVLSDVERENIQNEPTFYLPDSSIVLLVAPYKLNLDEDMSKVISVSTEELTKARPESKLTNLMADLLMQESILYINKNDENIVPDMAFVNYGGLRTSLPKGKITVGNIFELMPFENEMILLKLSGETMEQFVRQVAERGGDGISGVKLGIKDDQIAYCTIGGKPFNKDRDYWLVTNDYVAMGGDDMKMLLNRKEYLKTGLRIRDLIIENLSKRHQAGEDIQVQLDGRIYYEQ